MANDPRLYGTTSDSEKKKQVEGKPKADPLAQRYWKEVERYNRAVSDWYSEGDNIVQVYMDEAGSMRGSGTRRFALLWANTETLKPAVYAKTPTVLCSRRYKDRDPVARTAAEIMERATNTTLELYGVEEVFKMVRDDRLLPGRGTAWVRYEADIEEYEETILSIDMETGAEIEEVVTGERLVSEKACADYVYWQDFGHNIARTWADVWLVWRCVYKTREEVAERFGSKVASQLSYNTKTPVGGYNGARSEEGEDYAKIIEIWDKHRNLTSWMVEGQPGFLESGAPPINLANFFPCPEPCYATKSSNSLIPKPDYVYYRDQAKEINDLTDKIASMSQWLIVKGFVPGGPSSVADPIEEAVRDKGNRELFVQVDDWSQFSEKGGSGKLIDWLPIQNVAATLQAAMQARSQLIQDVYQITGIADVLRGQSDPNETATAVDMRAQTGTRRLRNTRDDLARFCRDIARMLAEIIAENFSPQSIAEITGFQYRPPQETMPGLPDMANVAMFPGAQAPMQQMPIPGHNGGQPQQGGMNPEDQSMTFDDRVIELLRSDKMRGFRIDIETDSTVQADENQEKAQRIEFVGAAGQYLERAAKIVSVAPALAQTAGELLLFATRSFRPGRTLEETIERGFAQLVQQAEAARNQPPQEDPVIQVAKVQVQGEIEKNRANAALKAKEIQTDAELELRKQNLDANLKLRQMDIDATAKARDSASRMMQRLPVRGTI